MKKKIVCSTIITTLVFVLSGVPRTFGFEAMRDRGKGCDECHKLSPVKAAILLKTKKYGASIKGVKMSPIEGLWAVEVLQKSKAITVYIDFAEKNVIFGKSIPIDQLGKPAVLRKVDVTTIPLKDAILLGREDSRYKIIVFEDPDCPYCRRLHKEIKKVLADRPDISFLIKMFPLDIHPEAYNKSKSIICSGSSKMLEAAMEGKPVAKPSCETRDVEKNIEMAKSLGITGTPTLIFPDGRLLPGYIKAETLFRLLDVH